MSNSIQRAYQRHRQALARKAKIRGYNKSRLSNNTSKILSGQQTELKRRGIHAKPKLERL